VIDTPGAANRFEKAPTGALSKSIGFTLPNAPAAASKLAAAASEFGNGPMTEAPASTALNVTI
jgi:hypothetical protein